MGDFDGHFQAAVAPVPIRQHFWSARPHHPASKRTAGAGQAPGPNGELPACIPLTSIALTFPHAAVAWKSGE
jgi:hypothetical protein